MRYIRPHSLDRLWSCISLVCCGLLCLAVANKALASQEQRPEFHEWYQALRDEAVARGISAATIKQALPDSLRLRERVIRKDRSQAEKDRTVAFYLKWVVSDDKIRKGRLIRSRYDAVLAEAQKRSGVQAEIITALWGLESYFGANQGKSEIIPSLVTLAYDKRRGAYFRRELFSALEILDAGDIALKDFKGSWAGAMGQVQFMPSSFLELAVDGDGDGRRDIWKNPVDVVNSAANFLAQRGWKRGEEWGRRVSLSHVIASEMIGRKTTPRTIQDWSLLGVLDHRGASLKDRPQLYRLIQPDGPETQAYLIGHNYDVLLRWNRSKHFGLSVGLLSDQIALR